MTDSESTGSLEEVPEPAPETSSSPSPVAPSSSLVANGELTGEGRREVARWVNEGLGLSEVQKRLADEHGFTLTYMETRFLVDDLDLDLQDADEPEPKTALAEEPESDLASVDEGAGSAEEQAAGENSGVTVAVDKVMRPGALVSGTVAFPDGVALQWQLDQFGRLALTPKEGYQPSEENLMAFQKQLQVELRKSGY